MSAPVTDEQVQAPTRRRRKAARKSIWKRDLGKGTPANEEVEHPPFVPTLPRVNLLPPTVAESFAVRRVTRVLIGVALLLLAGVATVWYLQGTKIAEAEAGLEANQSTNVAMQGRVEALAPIQEMYKQITGQQELVGTTLAAQPRAALVMSQLSSAAAKAGTARNPVTMDNVAVNYKGLPAAGGPLNSCSNPDPFGAEVTIGCVNFSGSAKTRAQVAKLLVVLDANPLFVGPYVSTTTAMDATSDTPGGISFTGTVGVAADALAKPLTPEQLAALNAPPAPAPTPEGGQ